MSNVPGFVYPPIHNNPEAKKVWDNLSYLRSQVDAHTAALDALNAPAAQPAPAVPASTNAQTVIAGSASGYAVFSQPNTSAFYKNVVIYCSALLGTVTYTFPTAFSQIPQVLSQSLTARVTAITANTVTLTGTTSTGFIELSGY